jgi:hypothetical protein
MHEAVAVDRNGLLITHASQNVRRGEIRAAGGPPADRPRASRFRGPRQSICCATARPAAPERLEAELLSTNGRAPRLEFTFSRITFDGRGFAGVGGRNDAARSEGKPGRGRVTAWEALDALGEECSPRTPKGSSST